MSSWKSCCSCMSQRCVFTILGCLGICIGGMLQVIISITIVEMVLPIETSWNQKVDNTCEDTRTVILKNETLILFSNAKNGSRIRYDWDEYTQGIILSSYFWTYSFSQCFCGFLSERFGGKYVFGLGIFIPAVITCLTPLIVGWGGSAALIASRALMGIPNASMFPASSTLVSRWTTPLERTKTGNTVYAGQLPGLFIGTVVPALMIKYLDMGWPIVFYFFGLVGIIWFIFWVLLVYDSPEQHPFISDKELAYLTSNRGTEESRSLSAAPWKHILKCKEFWVFTICLSGSDWAYYAMVNDLPKYMSGVVKFSIESNGYFSSVPYLFMWANSIISTWISDKVIQKQWVSLTTVRKIFTTMSVSGPSVFLLLASYAECNKVWVVAMFFVGITLMGSIYSSIMMNPLDLSPNYAGSLMSVGNGIGAIIGIVIPYIVGVLTPNQTIAEWRLVFWIVFSFAVASNVIYLIWFDAEVKDWNNLDPVRVRKNTTEDEVAVEMTDT